MSNERLRVQQFDGRLRRDVVDPFLAAQAASLRLRRDREARAIRRAKEIVVVGPFPVYTAVAATLLCSKQVGRSARRRGWRALVLNNGDPIATVDTGGSSSRRTSSVRGAEPARALHSAVVHAHAFARERGLDPTRHELRLLEVAEAFFTAVWLPGGHGFLVPTRAGGSKRPVPRAYTPDELIRLVARVYRRRRRRVVRPGSPSRTTTRRKGRVR